MEFGDLIAFAILLAVTVERVGTAVAGRRNARRLLKEGGIETGFSHYYPMVAIHGGWVTALWITAFGQPLNAALFGAYLLAVAFRFWAVATLGRRWTSRIVVIPGERLVARGPYRIMPHPIYIALMLEFLLLPAAFGLWWVMTVFSVLNAGILFIRIRAEQAALRRFAPEA